MKSLLSSLTLISLLLNASCGKINLTGDDERPLIDQAIDNASDPDRPYNVLPEEVQIAPLSKYAIVFDFLCAQQIEIANKIYIEISEGYPNADRCWDYLMNALRENPNLCTIPTSEHWTDRTYENFFLYLLSSQRCDVKINN